MDNHQISKKDQIILQQLEVIRTMTENNLSRMGSDFWGAPMAPLSADPPRTPAAPKAGAGPAPERKGGGPAASTGNDDTQAPSTDTPPVEKMEDLQKELDSYIGRSAV